MSKRRQIRTLIPAILLLALVITSTIPQGVTPAAAQSSANYNLEWHVVASGGQPVGSANYTVESTLGQTTGASAPPSSPNYIVGGGFWGGGGASLYRIYLPLVLRD